VVENRLSPSGPHNNRQVHNAGPPNHTERRVGDLEKQMNELRKMIEEKYKADEYNRATELAREREEFQKFLLMTRNAEPYNNAGPQTPWAPTTGQATSHNFTTMINNDNLVRNKSAIVCYHCRQPGHIARSCPRRGDPRWDGPPTLPMGTTVAAPTANLASTATTGDSPSTAVNQVVPTHNNNAVTVNRALMRTDDFDRVYIKALVNQVEHYCLLDTGCDLSVLPRDAVGYADVRPTQQRMVAANGTNLELVGETEIWCNFGDVIVKVKGLVSEHVHDIMLGRDFLVNNGATWNFADSTLSMHSRNYPLHTQSPGHWCRRVTLQEDTEVPARTESALMRDQVCQNAEPENDPRGVQVQPILKGLDDDIPAAERQQPEKSLSDHKDIFPQGEYDLSSTRLVKHSIDAGDQLLPHLLSAYDSAVHDNTGFNPNYLMLGHELRPPIDPALSDLSPPREIEIYNAFAAAQHKSFRTAFRRVRNRTKKCIERRGERYDLRVHDPKLDTGMLVWRCYSRHYTGRSPKWQRFNGNRFHGSPIPIIHRMSTANLIIQEGPRTPEMVAHIDQLKIYQSQVPASCVQRKPGPGLDTRVAEMAEPETIALPFHDRRLGESHGHGEERKFTVSEKVVGGDEGKSVDSPSTNDSRRKETRVKWAPTRLQA